MKKIILFLIIINTFTLNAQSQKKRKKINVVVPQRHIYLNSGSRASFFGGRSRVVIPVELPPNTVQWYYSFSTSPNKSGTQTLNLGLQLSTLLISPTPLGNAISENIEIPSGSGSADIILLDKENSNLFEKKVDLEGVRYNYNKEYSVHNTRQALVTVSNLDSGTIYLGLRNPNGIDGVSISIEVVAITEEYIQPNDKEEQAHNLGVLGRKSFEREDYDKCIKQSKKAIKLDPTLAFVRFNMALTYLIQGHSDLATDEYTKAMVLAKKTGSAKEVLNGAISDLNIFMDKIPDKAEAKSLLEILETAVKTFP